MSTGLQITFDVLAESHNACAVEALTAALDMAQREIKDGALRVLLKRPSPTGQRELIRQWNTFSQHWKSMIVERPEFLSTAINEGLRSDDSQWCENACEAILRSRDYDLGPALITALENRNHPRRDLLGLTLLTLAETLYEELASPRDYRVRHDPQAARQYVISALEPAVERYYVHHSVEILEAFLIIAHRESRTLNRILQNSEDTAHRPIADLLAHSPRPGIMRLLINSLDDPLTPQTGLNLLARRRDLTFLRQLCKKIGGDNSGALKFNIRRIDRIGWLDELTSLLNALNEKEQQALVAMIAGSGCSRPDVCGALRTLLRRGHGAARADAVKALNEFRSKETTEEVLLALSDPEPLVQANALRQLRDRRVPGSIDRLLDALENLHPAVQQAVRDSLNEFNFLRYMAAFEKLPDDVKLSTGKLVLRLDPTTVATLKLEFKSEWRKRRLRAVEIAIVMDVAPQLEQELINLLYDSDHFVVLRAIDALGACATPAVKQELERLLSGPENVRHAVESALRRHDEIPVASQAPIVSSAQLETLAAASGPVTAGATV